MSTNRYISTSFWDDEWIQTLDPSEKLMYLYFMTNPLTNIAGIYRITNKRISFDTGFNDTTIKYILEKFEKANKVHRIEDWIIINNWTKHQKISEKDNNRKGIDAILRSLPENIFSMLDIVGYKYIYMHELGRSLQAPSKPLARTSNYINTNLNLNSNLNSNNNPNSNTLPDSPNPVILPFSELVDIKPEKPKQEKERDTIRDYLNERYISEVKVFANPAKENASLKKISSAIKAKSSAEDINPLDAAKKLCDTQYALYKSGQAFWSEFTPSRLLYAFESAWAMMKKGHTSISSPNCRAKTLSDDECLRVEGT